MSSHEIDLGEVFSRQVESLDSILELFDMRRLKANLNLRLLFVAGFTERLEVFQFVVPAIVEGNDMV